MEHFDCCCRLLFFRLEWVQAGVTVLRQLLLVGAQRQEGDAWQQQQQQQQQQRLQQQQRASGRVSQLLQPHMLAAGELGLMRNEQFACNAMLVLILILISPTSWLAATAHGCNGTIADKRSHNSA
jgi:hypothetical protein